MCARADRREAAGAASSDLVSSNGKSRFGVCPTRRRSRRHEGPRQGKSPSSAAGEFVREEIEHVREGKARRTVHQAGHRHRAVKARRAGVHLKPPAPGRARPRTRKSAQHACESDRGGGPPALRRRVAAARRRAALRRKPRTAGSSEALSRQAKGAARRRSAEERSRAATRAATTKGARGRSRASKKAAITRQKRGGVGR